MLQLSWFWEVIAIDDKKRCQIDSCVFIWLFLKAFSVPINGIVQTFLVCMLGFYKFILQEKEKRENKKEKIREIKEQKKKISELLQI